MERLSPARLAFGSAGSKRPPRPLLPTGRVDLRPDERAIRLLPDPSTRGRQMSRAGHVRAQLDGCRAGGAPAMSVQEGIFGVTRGPPRLAGALLLSPPAPT